MAACPCSCGCVPAEDGAAAGGEAGLAQRLLVTPQGTCRIVLISGFESFNVALYEKARPLLRPSVSHAAHITSTARLAMILCVLKGCACALPYICPMQSICTAVCVLQNHGAIGHGCFISNVSPARDPMLCACTQRGRRHSGLRGGCRARERTSYVM